MVMSGDDQLEAQLSGELGLADAGDPAIDGNDEHRRIAFVKFGEGLAVEAVSLFEPVRDVVLDATTGQLQTVSQNTGGSDAVHVVVAVDGNAAVGLQRGDDG